MEQEDFQELVWQKGRELYRDMPWRRDTRPYYVLVSELMLQQTQVDRVVPKFLAFITAFPDLGSLAQASLADVLKLWQGLGYNRRAKFLHDCARKIETEYNGQFPYTREGLKALPGVGNNTAGAILVYSFNQPAVFVETNIRTVIFQHFFTDGEMIDDKEVAKLVAATVDTEHPREWYWAMMDYGAWLKRQGLGRLGTSKQYRKQSALKGSVREVRGQIIKTLADKDYSENELQKLVVADARFEPALTGLIKDGLVAKTEGHFHLTK